MVRGMPLKPMHLRPTSRMNSAFWTAESGCLEDATLWRTGRESGELRVNVAAAYTVSDCLLCSEVSSYRDSEPGPNAEVPHGSIIRDRLEQLLNLLRRRPRSRTRKRRIDQSLERSRELGHFGRFVLMRHDRRFARQTTWFCGQWRIRREPELGPRGRTPHSGGPESRG